MTILDINIVSFSVSHFFFTIPRCLLQIDLDYVNMYSGIMPINDKYELPEDRLVRIKKIR